MAETPILALPQIAVGQDQKEQVVNNDVLYLEGAMNAGLACDTSGGDVTLLATEFTRYYLFRAQGHSAVVTLTIPATKRVFAVSNEGTDDLTVEIVGALDSVVVAPDEIWQLYTDGTALSKVSSATADTTGFSFLSLTDTPSTYAGQALKYLRVNTGETALEFVASASVVSGVSDFETEYTTTAPTAPATGVSLFTRKRAGLNRAAHINPDGKIEELQFALYNKTVSFIQSNGATSWTGVGLVYTSQGTAAAGTLDFSSYVKSIRRTTLVTTVSTAGTVAYLLGSNYWMRRGTGADPAGGFEFVTRFGIETYLAGMTFAVGIWDNTSAPSGATDPTTQLTSKSGVIIYKNAADTNLKLAWCDGTNPVQTVNLGVNYPANTSATDYYELRLHCPEPGADIYYSLHRLNTGNITEGTLTTNLPGTAIMRNMMFISNRAATGSPMMALSNIYAVTD